MAMLAFAMTSLGVVIANRVRSFEGFGVFSNAVILPLYFTSSSIFPLNPALTGAADPRASTPNGWSPSSSTIH